MKRHLTRNHGVRKLKAGAPPAFTRHDFKLFIRSARLTFAMAALLGLGASIAEAGDILWSNSGGTSWLTGTNWTGNATPGTADIAQFGANPTSATGLGISMSGATNNGAANQAVGAIEVTSSRSSGAVTIGDSSTTTAGTLTLNGATVNSVADVILRNNSSVNLTLQPTQGASTLNMAVALADATANKIVLDGSGNIVISSVIKSASGTTPLTFMGGGSGRVDITGTANTFTGNINITGAEVRFSADGSLGNAANTITVDGGRLGIVSGGIVDLSARSIFLGQTAGTSISAPGAGVLTYNGVLKNKSGVAGILVKQGGGTLSLGGVSTYTGQTSINNGTVQLTTGNDRLPTGTVVNIGQSASANIGTLDLNGRSQTIAGLTSTAGTGGQTAGTTNVVTSTSAATLTVNTSGSNSYAFSDGTAANSGVLSGAISLIKMGTGTQTLGGANSYAGTTQINGGTLNVSGSITGTGAVSLTNANSTLITGTATTIGGTITANNGTILTIGGAGTVGKLTSGALTLNGGSALNFDLLSGASFDKINTGGVLTLGGGTETINVATAAAGTYTLLSGYTSLGGTGSLVLGSVASGFNYSLATGSTSTVLTVSSLGGSANVTWSLNGAGPAVDGAGTWTNGGTNFYNTGTSAATTWDNTGTYNLTVGNGGAGGTITLGGNVTVGGTLTFASVSSPYTIGTVGGTNTLTLTGGITANNSATINAPTILAASQTWSVGNGQTLTSNGSISETGGARLLAKDGAGTLVLAGTGNSYSGGTTINNGILSVSSGSSTGTGNVAVNSGATLAGAGTVNGTTSVASGTINGSGLTLTGAATFGGTGNNLNGTVTSVGGTILSGGSDLTVNGALTVTGNTVGPVAPVAVTINGNNSTLTNLGTITQTGTVAAGTGGRGVFNSASTGIVINNGSATNSTALIQTADGDVVRSNVGGVTLNNYGTLTSLNAAAGGSQAVDFNPITTGSNIINNFAGGTMQASEADAVRPGVNGVVNNSGLIKSTWATASSGSSSDGIDAQNNTGVVITNASNWSASSPTVAGTGTIEGARDGITGGAANSSVTFTTSVTNNLGGTIKGNNGSGINLDGFNANQTATIVNAGTITGNGRDIGNGASHDGDGIDVDGLVNVTNTGIIRSINSFNVLADGVAHSEGITVGGGTITNSGTIEGLVATGNANAIGIGISLLGNDITTGPLTGTREAIYGNAIVTNQAGGLIRGDSGSGILVDGPASGFTVTINNNAGATIRGGATVAGLGGTSAAILLGADNDTINNAGTIDGSSNGRAIDMGAGNNTLNITGGVASVLGSINGGVGGTNVMTIDPGANNGFSHAGTISNFSRVEIKSGTVTLSGGNTYTGSAVVSGGTLIASGTGGNQALGGASAINVSNGTLLLGASNQINNAATLAVGPGGTLATGGFSEGTSAPGQGAQIGALTLSASSTIDFQTGANGSSLLFAGLSYTAGDIVSIRNWTGTAGADNGLATNDRLLFFADPGFTSSQLAAIQFYNDFGIPIGSGAAGISFNGYIEFVPVIPVPEPATALGGIALVVLIGFRERRRVAGILGRLARRPGA